MAASDTDFHFVQASGNFSTPTVLTEPDQVATIEANAPKSISFWASARQKLLKDRLAVAWGIILILIVLAALIGPQIQHYDPNLIRVNSRNVGPSAAHWFGTDRLGRDLFTRTCIGVQVSLMVAILSTFLAIGFGTIYGMIMAFFGVFVDLTHIMLKVAAEITIIRCFHNGTLPFENIVQHIVRMSNDWDAAASVNFFSVLL